jgi:hypothetical protein
MSLSLKQWVQLIFVDVPEAKADLTTLTVADFSKKWIPRIETYGVDLEGAAVVSPQEAVKKISAGEVSPQDASVIAARSENPGGGG